MYQSSFARRALLALVAGAFCMGLAFGEDEEKKPEKPESQAKQMGKQLREALGVPIKKRDLTLSINGTPDKKEEHPQHSTVTRTSRLAQQARAEALGNLAHADAALVAAPVAAHAEAAPHWTYEGESGPANWGRLSPQFNVCAIGKRQSPINISETSTLKGPAEPIRFSYNPSEGTVVNNGHTIMVEVQGNNSIMVRGSVFHLLQFHFHTPSEERINYNQHPMVVHLVHQNDEGQYAVVAVLLDVGEANALINKVWTYMPLDTGDRVRMPSGSINLSEVLPTDQHYYQYFGSLTTPPCSENVLWMVMKQPLTISQAQYKLFSQLYPMNARPVQPVNGRPVRDGE